MTLLVMCVYGEKREGMSHSVHQTHTVYIDSYWLIASQMTWRTIGDAELLCPSYDPLTEDKQSKAYKGHLNATNT